MQGPSWKLPTMFAKSSILQIQLCWSQQCNSGVSLAWNFLLSHPVSPTTTTTHTHQESFPQSCACHIFPGKFEDNAAQFWHVWPQTKPDPSFTLSPFLQTTIPTLQANKLFSATTWWWKAWHDMQTCRDGGLCRLVVTKFSFFLWWLSFLWLNILSLFSPLCSARCLAWSNVGMQVTRTGRNNLPQPPSYFQSQRSHKH